MSGSRARKLNSSWEMAETRPVPPAATDPNFLRHVPKGPGPELSSLLERPFEWEEVYLALFPFSKRVRAPAACANAGCAICADYNLRATARPV